MVENQYLKALAIEAHAQAQSDLTKLENILGFMTAKENSIERDLSLLTEQYRARVAELKKQLVDIKQRIVEVRPKVALQKQVVTERLAKVGKVVNHYEQECPFCRKGVPNVRKHFEESKDCKKAYDARLKAKDAPIIEPPEKPTLPDAVVKQVQGEKAKSEINPDDVINEALK